MDTRETQILAAMTPAFDTFRHLPAWPDDDTPNPYLMGFAGIPPEYIAKAVVRSLQSTMPCHNRAFPTIPEFAADARNFMGAEYDKARRNREGLQAIEQRPQELTPEDVARRKALVSGALQRISLVDAKIPMSLEDAKRELRELAMRPKQSIEVSDELANLIKQQTAA